MQPGPPGQDPYGQQPPHDPYGQQPPHDPYGQPAPGQPADPYAQPPQAPYGQPAPGQPYGQPADPHAQPYGPPTHPGAGYPQPAGQQNTLGLVSMILGIVSIPMLCCFSLGIPLGIAAVVTGWMGRQKAAQGLASNGGQAKAGLICGAVAVGLGVLGLIVNLVVGFDGLPNRF
ncbi:DUF4190 domain-containing protein [Micromonospora sp. KC721]|uniref:DUF4190 domain-containing protein n=1 Tax=Micromonospora sp. KC721 TaxID=2530380 RepID=UPI00104891F8|nr:DUF4190 domain-containing protein [Micromonospora sp. KC721]TDB71999.1 hypothetical protein E1182_23985 [Micromonospora sp. KC721]